VTKYRHCDGYLVFKVTNDTTVRGMFLPPRQTDVENVRVRLVRSRLVFVDLPLGERGDVCVLSATLLLVRFVWFCGGV
jgi:hypothetical protein